MQADQTAISLRPGGGGDAFRGSRFLGPRFDSASSDAQLLRPHAGLLSSLKTGDLRFEGRECVRYTRNQLLQLREVVEIPKDILMIKPEIEAEFGGEDQSLGRADGNLQVLTPSQSASKVARFTDSTN